MKTIITLTLTLTLTGCITVSHTLKDGTTFRVNDAGHVAVTSGKSVLEFDLPKKRDGKTIIEPR